MEPVPRSVAATADRPRKGRLPLAARATDRLDSPLERLDLELPPQYHLPVGPDWLKMWHVPFFAVLLPASLAIKVVARIE